MKTVYTIGHSTHTTEEFVRLLNRQEGIFRGRHPCHRLHTALHLTVRRFTHMTGVNPEHG